MKSDIVLAITGALLGATIGGVKGEAIKNFVFRSVNAYFLKLSRVFSGDSAADKTFHD